MGGRRGGRLREMPRGPNFQEPALVHSCGIFIYFRAKGFVRTLNFFENHPRTLIKEKEWLFEINFVEHPWCNLAYCVCVQDRWAESFAKGAKVGGGQIRHSALECHYNSML